MSGPLPQQESPNLAKVRSVLEQLDEWGSARDWVGTDPYDGINARRVPAFAKRHPLMRTVLVQSVKRSPVNLRPLLGVPREANAASIAWVTSSYAILPELKGSGAAGALERMVQRLLSMRSARFEEPCWGYHWPFQSRVFRYDREEPNTIATTYAAMALLDAYERTGEESLLDVARGAGEFFLRHVPQTPADTGAYFGYWAGDRTPIHNANMHVCGLFARLSTHCDDERFVERGRLGVQYCLAHQREDGSWPYGELPNLGWVDNFHTGYVLDSLELCRQANLDDRVPAALERGLAYYERELFLADGTPKYYSDQIYPIDSQCVAQAIQTLAIASARDPRHLQTALGVFDFSLRKMRRRDGAFMFQRRRFWRNPAAHIRGTVASMHLALAYLARALEGGGPASNRLAAEDVVASDA
jgi:hypothetical protein